MSCPVSLGELPPVGVNFPYGFIQYLDDAGALVEGILPILRATMGGRPFHAAFLVDILLFLQKFLDPT